MDTLGGQRLLAGGGVQLADDLAGRLDRSRLPEHLEYVAPRHDLHPEPVLELTQVLIERTAQARESLIVRGLEVDVGFGARWRHDQREVSGGSQGFRYGVRISAAGVRAPGPTGR